jgi:hypothetical protein
MARGPGTAKVSVTDLFMGLTFSSYRREHGGQSSDESLLMVTESRR